MSTRNTDRIRFRYGICLNDNCEKCKSKEIQEIPVRKDFVCQNPECGKPLRECPPPKKGINKKVLGSIIGVVVLVIVGVVLLLGGSGEQSSKTGATSLQPETAVAPVDSDSIRLAQIEAENQRLKDSLAAAETEKAKKEMIREERTATPVAHTPKPSSSSSKNLGYATFMGSWPNDVNGRMVFNSSHVIDSRDPKGRVAEPGDYVIGEWSDGHLVQGIWYDSTGQVKGSVIIGK